MISIQRILHPTDLQDKSVEAFQWACQLARQNEAELIVLHVAPKGVVRYLNKVSEYDISQTHEKLWNVLRDKQAEEQGLNIAHRVEEGNPTNIILQAAKDESVDLIVLGPSNSEHVPWFRFNRGTLDEIVHKSPCSVLVAKPKTTPEPLPTEMEVSEAQMMVSEGMMKPPLS